MANVAPKANEDKGPVTSTFERKRANERSCDAVEPSDAFTASIDLESHLAKADALNFVLQQLRDTELDVSEAVDWCHVLIGDELSRARECHTKLHRAAMGRQEKTRGDA